MLRGIQSILEVLGQIVPLWKAIDGSVRGFVILALWLDA
jgi:hypothetical protein